MTQALINCRAQVAKGCYDGQPESLVYGDGNPITDDGTWQKDGCGCETIICDACYLLLCQYTPSGRGLSHELDAALQACLERNGK